ncbi:MAG: thiazole synthase, partial [Thermoleophilia bacterium]
MGHDARARGRRHRGRARRGRRIGASPVPEDDLVIAGTALRSRLLLGSGGFNHPDHLTAALRASSAELVTVAVR